MVEKPNIDAGFSRMLPEDLTGAVGPETGKEQGKNREIGKSFLALSDLNHLTD